jgi:hypothetical protein
VNWRAGRVTSVLALLAFDSKPGDAQDSAVVRVGFQVDTTRLQPYRRIYDILVQTRDSAVVIGQREVALAPATYAGNPAWLLVETRSGTVPAAETLYVTSSMRPLQWNSVLGAARLGATFVGDTVFGAVTAPSGRQSLIIAAPGRIVVSQAMAETLIPLLPLDVSWSDSTGVLAIDLGGGSVIPSELSVTGEEHVQVDSITARSMWVVALRSENRSIFLWVDRDTREVHRVQQQLPSHVGYLIEYRRRPDPAPAH